MDRLYKNCTNCIIILYKLNKWKVGKIMFTMYLGKILYALQRALSPSEIVKARQFFNDGVSVKYAIEYFK